MRTRVIADLKLSEKAVRKCIKKAGKLSGEGSEARCDVSYGMWLAERLIFAVLFGMWLAEW